jgi:hypothetical protein
MTIFLLVIGFDNALLLKHDSRVDIRALYSATVMPAEKRQAK